MLSIPEIDPSSAKLQLDEGGVTVLDIRDAGSYKLGRIPGARHISNSSITDFIDEADKSQPVIVCCYHGNSSKGATAYLLEQGFADVRSLSGGFEMWKHNFEVER